MNPEVDDCEKVVEALQKIFACRLLDETVEKLLDELKVLTGQETSKAVLMMWLEWRNAVKKLELNEQACVVLKTARSKRLYCKSRKQREIIKELFDIGFGLYEPGTKCDFQRGAENAFMYGYLMGMKADGVTAVKGGAA